MTFSERFGFSKIKNVIQLDKIDDNLSNDIFNFISSTYFEDTSVLYENVKLIWHKHFHKLGSGSVEDVLYKYKMSTFYEKYDLLEFVVQNCSSAIYMSLALDMRNSQKEVNQILKDGNSGYRFSKNELIAVSDEQSLTSIESASESNIDGGHIDKAVSELANRENANYNTICKEAIDAVEIAAKKISVEKFEGNEKETLGKSIKNLSDHGFIDDHNAYYLALGNLYGFASDGGIRHPKDREYKIDKADAIFMLTVCSAFINLLKTKI